MTPEEIAAKEAELKAKADALTLEENAQRDAKKKHNIEVGEDKAKRELERRDAIDGMVDFAVEGMGLDFKDISTEAQRMKKDGGEPSELKGFIMKKVGERNALTAKDNNLGLTDKEQVEFSMVKAIRAAHRGEFTASNKEVSFEFAVCGEAEAAQPVCIDPAVSGGRGFTLPQDITHSHARRAAITPNDVATMNAYFQKTGARTMSVDQATLGGAWTLPGMTQTRFIDFLRAATIIDQIGIVKIPGLMGDLPFAVLDDIQTAYNRGQHEEAQLTDLTTSNRKMSPRLVTSGTNLQYLLTIQAGGMGIEALVERNLAYAQAQQRNKQVLYGTGQGREMLGVFNHTGVNLVAGGTNGAVPSIDNYIIMDTLVSAANAAGLPGQMVWLMNSLTIGKNRRTKIESGQTDRVMPINMPAGSELSLLARPVKESQLLRSNLTKGSGTNLSECAFVNPQEMYYGEWGVMRILVDTVSGILKDEKRTVIHEYADFMVGHPEAISIMNDIITT